MARITGLRNRQLAVQLRLVACVHQAQMTAVLPAMGAGRSNHRVEPAVMFLGDAQGSAASHRSHQVAPLQPLEQRMIPVTLHRIRYNRVIGYRHIGMGWEFRLAQEYHDRTIT